MSLRVGCAPYLNTLPIHLPFSLGKVQSDVEFVYAIPTELNAMLRKQAVDIALTSSVESLDTPHLYLPEFGVAAKQKVLSVNLYTQTSPLALDDVEIAVTHHSSTSIALLKLLCQREWKVEPKMVPLNRQLPFSHYQALLLIGDEALENQTIPGFTTHDLASAWYQMTTLSFVFALFAICEGVNSHKVTQFRNELDQALTWSEHHKEQIEQEAVKRSQLSPQLIQSYFSHLIFRLRSNEIESLKVFKALRET